MTLNDVHTPVFAVATTGDHIAPWQSVYKLHLLTDTDLTFVLASGGHNAGIVAEPGRKGRRFQVDTRPAHDAYVPPDQWVRQTPVTEGSWWPCWTDWLASQSQARAAPPGLGTAALPALADAPGTYVLQH